MNNSRLRLHVESFFVRPRGYLAGAKFLTYQLDELPIGLADLIATLRRPKVILLYREQILEQYASLKLAEQTGHWHWNAPLTGRPIWLEPTDFLPFAERERRMWRENLAVLGDSDVHFVSYEQLHSAPGESMRSVFAFLGLKNCPVESFVAKLHNRPLSEKLTNYPELVRSGLVADAVLRLPFSDQPRSSQAGRWTRVDETQIDPNGLGQPATGGWRRPEAGEERFRPLRPPISSAMPV